jgi:hypothetical protein
MTTQLRSSNKFMSLIHHYPLGPSLPNYFFSFASPKLKLKFPHPSKVLFFSFLFLFHLLFQKKFSLFLIKKSFLFPLLHLFFFILLPSFFFNHTLQANKNAKLTRCQNIPKILIAINLKNIFLSCSTIFVINTGLCIQRTD